MGDEGSGEQGGGGDGGATGGVVGGGGGGAQLDPRSVRSVLDRPSSREDGVRLHGQPGGAAP